MFKMVNATNDNIDLLKRIRFESIPVTLVSDDLIKYVNEMTEKYLSYFKLIIVDDAIAGVFLAYPFLDGTIIDELFIYEEHRHKGIGTAIINDLAEFPIYVWVYKENKYAIEMYKNLGFKIVLESETRFQLKKTQ